jgi:hypothetical protein
MGQPHMEKWVWYMVFVLHNQQQGDKLSGCKHNWEVYVVRNITYMLMMLCYMDMKIAITDSGKQLGYDKLRAKQTEAMTHSFKATMSSFLFQLGMECP